MNIKRGNIYLANLNPTVSSEINKIRPVVVISNNLNNQFNNLVTIIPITSNIIKIYPFEVFVPAGVAGLTKNSKLKTDNIRAIDKIRLIKEIGELPNSYVIQVEEALKIHLFL